MCWFPLRFPSFITWKCLHFVFVVCYFLSSFVPTSSVLHKFIWFQFSLASMLRCAYLAWSKQFYGIKMLQQIIIMDVNLYYLLADWPTLRALGYIVAWSKWDSFTGLKLHIHHVEVIIREDVKTVLHPKIHRKAENAFHYFSNSTSHIRSSLVMHNDIEMNFDN